MAKDYNFKRSPDKGGSGPASGMHLFDFNETLSGRRLPEEKRVAIEMQMDRLYRGRGFVDFPTPRHSGAKREDGEIIRTMLKTSDKKLHHLQGGNEFVLKELITREKQRSPNVVARLMGLETLPSESVPVEQSKKRVEKVPHKSVVEKQSRKQRQRQDSPPVEMPAQKEVFYANSPFYHPEDKARFNQSRRSEERKQSAAQELPDIFELEEMKRQLALKQMLVREKLNEAKRLLTGEKLSDKKWLAANEKLNHSKEFLGAIDFFQTNREAFLNYLDEQDSVLSKHLQNLPGTLPRQQAAEKPPPEGLRNPIVRKVIEGRRDDELRLFLSRQSDVKGINRNYSPSRDSIKNPLPDNQAPTRIVVLKPSPNRNPSSRHTPPSISPRTYTDVRDLIESTRPQVVVKKVADIPKDEAGANPREIAKEIARQVRENVVRELARNVTGATAVELSSEKRLNVTNDNQEPPKLGTRGFSSDYMRSGGTGGASSLPTEGLTSATGKNNKLRSRVPLEHVDECSRKPLHSLQKKATRLGASRQASGSSPQVTRPVSKGIVVLVPDPSVSSKASKVSEAQNRETVQASKQPPRKDSRSRRNQPVFSETPAHKLGDCFRKTRSIEALDPDIESMHEESTNSGKDGIGDKTLECSLDSGAVCIKEQIMPDSGSFLLRTSCSESQVENEECSDIKDTVESGCASEGVSNMRFQSDNSGAQSDCVLSSESLLTGPSSALVTQTEFEPEDEDEEISGTLQSSSGCHMTVIEVVQELEVSREEEPIRECAMTSDVVDVDETSVSSDNSGQPSPVSVLESSFEESPDHVDFETISSELEELRMHLRLLKWEGDDQAGLDDLEEISELDTVIVDKVVVEDHSGPSIQKTPVVFDNAGVQEAVNGLEWLEWETFQIGDLPCPDGRKEDQVYVTNLLLASGFISNTNAGIFLAEQYSSGHALDPSLFEKLEGYYKHINIKAVGTDQGADSALVLTAEPKSCLVNRRLLFEMVDEILTHRYLRYPWNSSNVRQVPAGNLLLAEVWSRLCDYVFPQGEDLQHTVENLIEKYLTKDDNWMDLRVHAEAIGMDLESELLNELFEETICCFALL